MQLHNKAVFIRCISIAATMLFFAVVLGAFGAHALEKIFEAKQLANWQTAINYMVVHAFALIVVAVLMQFLPNQQKLLQRAGQAFLWGVILFSGSLYIWALTLFTPLVMLTPIGGIAFLIGWSLVLWALRKASKEKD